MKNIIKFALLLLLSVTFSCSTSDGRFKDEPTSGWVEFDVSTPGTTISPVTTQLVLPVSVNVPVYPNGLNISYELQAVQGDFTQIVSTGNNIYLDPQDLDRDAEVVLDFQNIAGLPTVIIFDVVITGADADGVTVGIGDESITRYRVSTPCPILVTPGYTAVSSVYNATAAPNGYAVVATEVAGMDFTYSLDTVWGPSFISTLCGGCVPSGNYKAPITFSINPTNFAITVLSGGEPAGSGNALDIPYVVGGTGSYDSCNNTLTFNLTQNLLTSGGVPGTARVVLQGN
jgi:hypothetical protein